MNTFGALFRVTTFGESHGPALGAVIDGCPAGVSLTTAQVQAALAAASARSVGGHHSSQSKPTRSSCSRASSKTKP